VQEVRASAQSVCKVKMQCMYRAAVGEEVAVARKKQAGEGGSASRQATKKKKK